MLLKLTRPFHASACLILVFILLGCDGSSLPNGYEILFLNSRDIVIVNPSGESIIGPKIKTYAYHGDVVIGEVEHPESLVLSGYFILNTSTGSLRQFDQYLEWSRAIRNELGIAVNDIQFSRDL